MIDRLIEATGSLLERRTSRRGMLASTALAGSAFVVAPLRYLLRPVSAWAVIGPGSCGGGLCDDGYTAFCCEINQRKERLPFEHVHRRLVDVHRLRRRRGYAQPKGFATTSTAADPR